MSEISEAPSHLHDRYTDGEDTGDETGDEGEDVSARFASIRYDLENNKVDLNDPTQFASFVSRYESCLGKKERVHEDTLLHALVSDAKDKVFEKYKPLVKLLIERYPGLLEETNDGQKTALYVAASKDRRNKLVRFICESVKDIGRIIGITCSQTENCVHVAIRKGASLDTLRLLIQHARPEDLLAKNIDGYTPLHLAVSYDRCVPNQVQLVEAIISRSDKTMDERTTSKDSSKDKLSPFQYHEQTRIQFFEAIKINEGKLSAAIRTEQETTKQDLDDEGPDLDGRKTNPKEPSKEVVRDSKTENGPDKEIISASKASGPKGPEKGSTLPDRGFGPPRRTKTGQEFLPGARAPLPNSGRTRGTDSITKTTSARKSIKRAQSENKTVTKESATAVSNFLKLHYMRTRSHESTVDFLYGRGVEKQIYFDLSDEAPGPLNGDYFLKGLNHVEFEDTLQYVAIPFLHVKRKPQVLKANVKDDSHPLDGNGRGDLVFLFNFLERKNIKRIIRLTIDDMRSPAHSDEAIEMCLAPFDIEVWDWRKIDICIATILTSARDVREVYLYWSGNNAVLWGWSDTQGLALLKKLERVILRVEPGLETHNRTKNNILEFKTRLKKLCETVVVETPDPDLQYVNKHQTGGNGSEPGIDQRERHKWIAIMDEFSDVIQNIARNIQFPDRGKLEPIVVALIDDGVNASEPSLQDRVVGGRSFCQRDPFQKQSPYYVSGGGHGTAMASLIARVCPTVQLLSVKLDEYMNEEKQRQITAKSAAKAIRWAVDRGVDIISMSWTIEKDASNTEDISELESAIETAASANILIFCSASDQANNSDNKSFPASCNTKKLFKIGAAEDTGERWKFTESDSDFFFPGHNISRDRAGDTSFSKSKPLTGSSVATAFASGLAALILYCIQCGALLKNPQFQVSMDDYRSMKQHERMKEAFLAIGTAPQTRNKYIAVWHIFEPATRKANGAGAGNKSQKNDILAEVAFRLKMRKSLE